MSFGFARLLPSLALACDDRTLEFEALQTLRNKYKFTPEEHGIDEDGSPLTRSKPGKGYVQEVVLLPVVMRARG